MKLYNISVNNLIRRKAKMLLLILGLSIGIATVVSVNSMVDSMKTELTRQTSDFGANVIITPESGGLSFSYGGIVLPEIMYDREVLTENDVNALTGLTSGNMIKALVPKLIGFADLDNGSKVMITGVDPIQEFTIKPWLRIFDGTAANTDNKMGFEFIDLARQDLEKVLLSDDMVIIGSLLASSMNIKEGEAIMLSGEMFTVKGILDETGAAEDEQIIMNLKASQKLLDRNNEITVIELAVDYFTGSEESLITEINSALPHVNVTSLRQETLRRDELLIRLVRFGTSVSVLILFAGMLVVSLTMTGSVRERTREIGVFRALGFKKAHIAKIILMESVLISIAGGILGYVLGLISALYAGPAISGMDLTVAWRMDLFVLSIVLSLVMGIVSALYPAYKASGQDPVEALRFI